MYGLEVLTLNKSDSNMGKENVEKNIWSINPYPANVENMVSF
jgi:hypothetical protein